MNCPVCKADLLTWTEYHKREHHEGIAAMCGILDFNSYCFLPEDEKARPFGEPNKDHPFFCHQHQQIHPKWCDHDYSVVEDVFEAACPKCGDTLTNAANLRQWLYS